MIRFDKIVFLVLAGVLMFGMGSAQGDITPERLWQSGSASFDGSFDAAYGVAYDAVGNAILAGFFQGDLADVSAQGRDAFIVSVNDAGEVNWLAQVGGAGDDKALNVATDNDGNIFVVGYVSGEATLDGVTPDGVILGDSALEASTFVAKFASDGTLQWAQTLASTGVTYGYGVTADGAGGVFVAGFFSGDLNVLEPVTAQGSSDIFTLHLDADGAPQWLTALGGAAGDVAYDVARDTAGNLYLAGRFRDTFDLVTLDGDVTLNAIGDRDALLVSLTDAGDVRWAQSWGGDGADVAWSVATYENNVYAAGYFAGYANLDPDANPDMRLRAEGTLDSFVAAFDDSGQFQWGKQRSSSGLASAHDLAVDSSGVIYEVGRASDSLPGAGTGPLRGYMSQYNAAGDLINNVVLDVSSVQGVAVSPGLTAYLAAYGQVMDSEDVLSANAKAQLWQFVQVPSRADTPAAPATNETDAEDTSEDTPTGEVPNEDETATEDTSNEPPADISTEEESTEEESTEDSSSTAASDSTQEATPEVSDDGSSNPLEGVESAPEPDSGDTETLSDESD